MKNVLITVALLSAMIFSISSCKKDKDEDPTSTTGGSTTTDPIQIKLNAGETPLSIYNEDNANYDKLIGKTYQGGLIFYFDITTGKGLVAAPTDQANQDNKVTWGCKGTELGNIITPPIGPSFVAAVAKNQGLFGGKNNTTEILDKCSTSEAAKLCGNLTLSGYSDWYLPSMQEVEKLLKEIPQEGSYWTSSQQSANYSWKVTKLGHSTHPKNFGAKVRAVRQFVEPVTKH